MARTDNLENFLTDVANAIRNKKETTDTISAENFDTEIESIETDSGEVKLFETIEQLEADNTVKDGDLALVYNSEDGTVGYYKYQTFYGGYIPKLADVNLSSGHYVQVGATNDRIDTSNLDALVQKIITENNFKMLRFMGAYDEAVSLDNICLSVINGKLYAYIIMCDCNRYDWSDSIKNKYTDLCISCDRTFMLLDEEDTNRLSNNIGTFLQKVSSGARLELNNVKLCTYLLDLNNQTYKLINEYEIEPKEDDTYYYYNAPDVLGDNVLFYHSPNSSSFTSMYKMSDASFNILIYIDNIDGKYDRLGNYTDWLLLEKSNYLDTSDATLYSSDLIKDKTAYSNGVKIVGTANIPDPDTIIKCFNSIEELENSEDNTFGSLAVVYGDGYAMSLPENPQTWGSTTIENPHCLDNITMSNNGSISFTGYDESGTSYKLNCEVTDQYCTVKYEDTLILKYTSDDGVIYHRETELENDAFPYVKINVLHSVDYTVALQFLYAKKKCFNGIYQYQSGDDGTKYYLADTQFTLSSGSELVPNTIAYGKNGVTTGNWDTYFGVNTTTKLKILWGKDSLHSTAYGTTVYNKLISQLVTIKDLGVANTVLLKETNESEDKAIFINQPNSKGTALLNSQYYYEKDVTNSKFYIHNIESDDVIEYDIPNLNNSATIKSTEDYVFINVFDSDGITFTVYKLGIKEFYIKHSEATNINDILPDNSLTSFSIYWGCLNSKYNKLYYYLDGNCQSIIMGYININTLENTVLYSRALSVTTMYDHFLASDVEGKVYFSYTYASTTRSLLIFDIASDELISSNIDISVSRRAVISGFTNYVCNPILYKLEDNKLYVNDGYILDLTTLEILHDTTETCVYYSDYNNQYIICQKAFSNTTDGYYKKLTITDLSDNTSYDILNLPYYYSPISDGQHYNSSISYLPVVIQGKLNFWLGADNGLGKIYDLYTDVSYPNAMVCLSVNGNSYYHQYACCKNDLNNPITSEEYNTALETASDILGEEETE